MLVWSDFTCARRLRRPLMLRAWPSVIMLQASACLPSYKIILPLCTKTSSARHQTTAVLTMPLVEETGGAVASACRPSSRIKRMPAPDIICPRYTDLQADREQDRGSAGMNRAEWRDTRVKTKWLAAEPSPKSSPSASQGVHEQRGGPAGGVCAAVQHPVAQLPGRGVEAPAAQRPWLLHPGAHAARRRRQAPQPLRPPVRPAPLLRTNGGTLLQCSLLELMLQCVRPGCRLREGHGASCPTLQLDQIVR